ncbi:MAG TPA: hypothetical protein VF590_11975 [Isosphaeraceae bacterium]
MPQPEEKITEYGALVDIAVGLSPLQAQAAKEQGLSVPPPVLAKALLDTGSNITLIDGMIASELG